MAIRVCHHYECATSRSVPTPIVAHHYESATTRSVPPPRVAHHYESATTRSLPPPRVAHHHEWTPKFGILLDEMETGIVEGPRGALGPKNCACRHVVFSCNMLNDLLGVSEISRDLNKVFNPKQQPKSSQHPLAASVDVSRVIAPEGIKKRKDPQHWIIKYTIAGGLHWPCWRKQNDTSESEVSVVNLPPTVRERYKALLYDDTTYVSEIAPMTTGDWSKEETDYLMNLCFDFDLRWPVIYDRYQWPQKRSLDNQSDAAVMSKGDEADEDVVTRTRDMEDLKHRFYRVCYQMSQYVSRSEEDRAHKYGTFTFDPQTERQRKEKLESRYIVNVTLRDRESRLRALVGLLQEAIKEEAQEEKNSGTHIKVEDDTTVTHAPLGEVENDDLKKIEQSLLPIMNISSVLYKGKGVTLASSLIRQNSESLFASLLPQSARKTGGVAGNSAPSTSRISQTGASAGAAFGNLSEVSGPAGNQQTRATFNVKELCEGLQKTLKSVIQECGSASFPGGVVVHASDDSKVSIHPKKYFSHSLLPPVNSRRALDAYTHMRIGGAVLTQLQKERDQLNQIYETWVNRLMDLRKGLRNSRRGLARPTTGQSTHASASSMRSSADYSNNKWREGNYAKT